MMTILIVNQTLKLYNWQINLKGEVARKNCSQEDRNGICKEEGKSAVNLFYVRPNDKMREIGILKKICREALDELHKTKE